MFTLEDLLRHFPFVKSVPGEAHPRYNIAPTQPVLTIPNNHPDRLEMFHWGLIPSWAKDPSIGNRMINARVETVAEKPAYRKAFASRRCLLPADGYYEWYVLEEEQPTEGSRKPKPRKQPFYIHPADGSVMAMAGLYEIWRDPTRAEDDPERFRWTCTVLTTSAQDELGRIHDRMPLLVDRGNYAAWLDPTTSDKDRLDALLVPAAPGRLEAYPVSTLVSNVRNNGPELVEPLPPEPHDPLPGSAGA
ncbi:MAG: SOS response-associated peptidase [Nocardioidaceae bacterium]